MNVLLIGPCINEGKTFDHLGLRYLASALQTEGHTAKVYLQADKSDFTGVARAISDSNPSIIGIYCNTPLRNQALRLAEMSKNLHPEATTIIGGPHATLAPDDLMKYAYVDYLIKGEGEFAISQMAGLIEQGNSKDIRRVVSGLVYRDGAAIQSNPVFMTPNLDMLHFPAVPENSLSHVVKTKDADQEYHSIISSRGCPYDCAFCSNSKILGRMIRRRSIENLTEELNQFSQRGWQNITFLDDTLTASSSYFSNLVHSLKESEFRWIAQSRVDIHHKIDFDALKESGCFQLEFGVESGSERVLNYLAKKISVEDTVESFRKCNDAGIRTFANFIIGSPYEQERDLEDTFKLLELIDPTMAGLWIATPYPGTKMYLDAKREGMLTYDGDELYQVIEQMNSKGMPGFTGYFKNNAELFPKAQRLVDRCGMKERIFKPRNNFSSFVPSSYGGGVL